jgi:SAM-dependent MidA family methyltransferase
MAWVSWRAATRDALYGARGFYTRPEGPAGHFRTSAHASPLFARALARLAREAGLRRVLDMGAGRGELLIALHAVDPALALTGVEVVERPGDLPIAVGWATDLPERVEDTLVLANEWLDTVPCEVAEGVDGVWRLVLVEPRTGRERLDGPLEPADAAWMDRWWPLISDGDRAEVGRSRDLAWADLVSRLDRAVAVAVDYGHTRRTRPPAGTLAGYRAGRAVRPIPDGCRDVTAHVALDACAAAGQAAGATCTLLTTQGVALGALGVAGFRPPLDLAAREPAAYLRGLAAAGQAWELTDLAGLGGFGWLAQSVGVPLPRPWVGLAGADGGRGPANAG